MDIAEIQRQASAAREFNVQIDGAAFKLRLPTRLDSRVALARVLATHADESDNDVLAIHVERQALVQSVLRWDGVPMRWVLADTNDLKAQCEFQVGLVGLLLDERPDIADHLSRELFARLQAFNEIRDTAAKN